MRPSKIKLALKAPCGMDEAGAFGDLVVEAPRRRIGLMCHPVEASGAIFTRKVGNGLDQGRSSSTAALVGFDIEVL
ncbi:hypothetical protein AJ87_20295 [Rhizobium yanglingense]|nr:hypothetical protein AJ87_20295 [Rhizobium yanglingense]